MEQYLETAQSFGVTHNDALTMLSVSMMIVWASWRFVAFVRRCRNDRSADASVNSPTGREILNLLDAPVREGERPWLFLKDDEDRTKIVRNGKIVVSKDGSVGVMTDVNTVKDITDTMKPWEKKIVARKAAGVRAALVKAQEEVLVREAVNTLRGCA